METLRTWDAPPLLAELAKVPPSKRPAMLRPVRTPIARGPLTTFIYLGQAEEVRVEHFMARFPAFPPMRRIARDLHAVTVRLPEGARVEYMLSVTTNGHTTTIADPYNPRFASNPFGGNSVATAHGYQEPAWAAETGAPRGTLRRGFVESKAFGHRRPVHWYHPANPTTLMPLLVVHDGSDFVDHAGLVEALDNLIGNGTISPALVALIDPHDRPVEYTGDRRHAGFVTEVVGAAVRTHGAHPDRARHVYLGASMGAVAALSAAWTVGGTGGLVLLSGSFVTELGGPMNRGEHFLPVIDFMEDFAGDPGHPAARIYQACGAYEGLAPDNRAFEPVLRATGADLLFEEIPDGHHWHNWRDRLGRALAHTFPRPEASGSGTVRA